ncbi:hypothetical protein [Microcystis sp.]
MTGKLTYISLPLVLSIASPSFLPVEPAIDTAPNAVVRDSEQYRSLSG